MKKHTTKLLSVLLTLVMLLSLLPATALAADTTITTINIKGITAPVADATPVITGITTDTAGIRLGEIQWLKSDGVIMQSTDKFEASVEYLLKIKYTVDTGYELSNTATVTSDSDHNSSNVDYVNTAVRLYYKVPEAAKYTVAVIGGTVSLRTPIPGEEVTSVSTEAGNRLLLKAPAVSGKRFTGWIGLDGVTLYGDNAKVTDSSLQFIMPAKNLTVTANYQDAVEITTVNIKGITKPLAGANPVTTGITTDTIGLSVKDATWYFDKTPSTSVAHNYEFQLGDKIKLLIVLDVADGYKFADSVTITADLEYTAAYRGLTDGTVYLEYTVTEEMPTTYTVTFVANGGTSTMADVTGISGEYTLPENGFTAPDGKQFKAWSVGGVEKAVGEKITVTANTTVTAVWEAIEYNVTVTGGTASVSAGTPITKATMGTTVTLTANAAPTDKVFDKWEVVSGSITLADANSATATFVMPAGAVSVKATYKAAPHTHTFDQGTIKGAALKTAADCTHDAVYYKSCSCGTISTNDADTFTDTDSALGHDWPEEGSWSKDADNHWYECSRCHLKKDEAAHTASDWITDTAATATTDGTKYKECTVCHRELETGTIPATGSSSGGGGGVSTYAITVDSAKNGDVTTSHKTASKGTTVTLTVEPDKGYTLETLSVTDKNGKEIELTNKGDGKYTFKMPASKVYVEATFMEDNSMLNFFVDVPADAYYYDAVLWAAKNGITGGVDDTHFAPNATCTRAQAVTFLWRAAGSPAPKSSEMPFEDVAAGSYYYDAVLWAVENGITNGTSATAFSPNATCSRGQIVTFLWRSQKSPASDSVNPFADVAAEAYYVDAVLWAVEEKVTKGTSETTFSPDADCTRAQIVTFLYRALNEQ